MVASAVQLTHGKPRSDRNVPFTPGQQGGAAQVIYFHDKCLSTGYIYPSINSLYTAAYDEITGEVD